MTYPGINLPSEDLKSKFGFHDGDILYSYCDQHDLDDLWKNVGVKDVLCLLVERHLLPLLPGVRTYRICSIHNPIRAEDGCEVPANIVAHVTHEQVVAAIDEVRTDGAHRVRAGPEAGGMTTPILIRLPDGVKEGE